MKIGDYNTLKVSRQTRDKILLASEAGEIPLISKIKRKPVNPGDELDVFVYPTADDGLVATLLYPFATLHDFACMTVVDTNEYGAYLDWGIEKNLFVYKNEQIKTMKEGKSYVVYVRLHENTGTLQGSSKLDAYFEIDTGKLSKGDKVSLLIYDITEIGIMAVVNNRYSGMLYINECFEKLKIGDRKEGFVKKIRVDGKIDLTLQAEIGQAISGAKEKILNKLTEAGGFLPYHDKSDPEEIKLAFNLSKKNFKKALGGLYKDGLVQLLSNGIQLNRKGF